jgi:hypothetical protein
VSVLDELKSKPWFPWAVGAGVMCFFSGFSSDPQRRPFDMSFKAIAANDGYCRSKGILIYRRRMDTMQDNFFWHFLSKQRS